MAFCVEFDQSLPLKIGFQRVSSSIIFSIRNKVNSKPQAMNHCEHISIFELVSLPTEWFEVFRTNICLCKCSARYSGGFQNFETAMAGEMYVFNSMLPYIDIFKHKA